MLLTRRGFLGTLLAGAASVAIPNIGMAGNAAPVIKKPVEDFVVYTEPSLDDVHYVVDRMLYMVHAQIKVGVGHDGNVVFDKVYHVTHLVEKQHIEEYKEVAKQDLLSMVKKEFPGAHLVQLPNEEYYARIRY